MYVRYNDSSGVGTLSKEVVVPTTVGLVIISPLRKNPELEPCFKDFQHLSFETSLWVLITLNFGMDSPCKQFQNLKISSLRAQLGSRGFNISKYPN